MGSYQELTPIQKFYKGTKIFITGGTGFLGQILVEKLLRSCPEIKQIYLLVRPKRGKIIQCRMEELFDGPLFDKLKMQNPKFRDKLVAMEGDCSLPDLGLEPSNKEILINEVS